MTPDQTTFESQRRVADALIEYGNRYFYQNATVSDPSTILRDFIIDTLHWLNSQPRTYDADGILSAALSTFSAEIDAERHDE